jgi:hypothetical protein
MNLRAIRVLLARLVPRREPRPQRASRLVRTRHGGRVAVAWFAVTVLLIHGAVLLALADSRVRDPEYGRRASHLRARLAENPGRPLVLVVGSSRTAMGVCPAAWEEARPADPARPDPLIFNAAVLGAGPVMELMALRRAYADGFRPAVVLIEYWPPFFHHDDHWAESRRVAVDRLMDCDRALVRDYFPEADRIEREMDWRRRSPIFANRERLLGQLLPKWVPMAKRADAGWTGLDGWGWLPGFDLKPEMTDWRAKAVANCADIYRPLFAKYRIAPAADRALREAVALARGHGAAVGFVYLPESSEFRDIYPRRVERVAKEHLANVSRELGVPVIDCRTWMPDESIVDGFHLSKRGAADFTRKFGPAVSATFPGAEGWK